MEIYEEKNDCRINKSLITNKKGLLSLVFHFNGFVHDLIIEQKAHIQYKQFNMPFAEGRVMELFDACPLMLR